MAKAQITELTYFPNARASKDMYGRKVYKPILVTAWPNSFGGVSKETKVLGRGGMYLGSTTQGITYNDRDQAIAHANEYLKKCKAHYEAQVLKYEAEMERARERGSDNLLRCATKNRDKYMRDVRACQIREDLVFDPSSANCESVEKEEEFFLNL